MSSVAPVTRDPLSLQIGRLALDVATREKPTLVAPPNATDRELYSWLGTLTDRMTPDERKLLAEYGNQMDARAAG